ncbi:MAG: cupin [Actinomycetota bacterium]
MVEARHLKLFPLHLAANGGALELDHFTGEPGWYASYEQEFAIDGAAGRLVSWHSFDSSWDMWEMHPRGDEIVLCIEGAIELVQEIDGHSLITCLAPGQWAVNKAGTWHTANLDHGLTATCVFITSGLGTQHRSR